MQALLIDMPLRNEDREWIRNEIHSQIKVAITPQGWRKGIELIRQAGAPIAVIGVFVAMLAITLGALYQAFAHVKEETTFRTHTEDRLTAIEDSLKRLTTAVDGIKLTQISAGPIDKHTIAEAKRIIEGATATKTKLDVAVVEDVGQKFASQGVTNAPAWDAAIAFMGYRTTLNQSPISLEVGIRYSPMAHYDYSFILNYQHPGTIVSEGVESPPKLAQFRPISGPDQNSSSTTGPRFLIVKDAVLVLDGLYAEHVVVTNSHVIYRGGQVELKDVVFVNCTFEVVRQPIGQEFAVKVLKAEQTFALG